MSGGLPLKQDGSCRDKESQKLSEHRPPSSPCETPSPLLGVRRAGENRRSKFVKSVSLKRQALYGKNRVQEARESGERKVEGTDE